MVFSNLFVASIKVNGKILREYQNEVLLPFGSEYSILLKNLNSKRAKIKISIDGKDVLNGRSLIIDANTTSEIERFVNDLNKGNRFKFIEKTQEISDYRGDNIDDGIVRIEYQFESYSWGTYITYTSVPTAGSSDVYYSDNISRSCNQPVSQCFNHVMHENPIRRRNFNEQGITVEGNISNQQFSEGYIGNLDPQVYVITIHLKGKTNEKIRTPITTRSKFLCKTCGKWSKSSEKFCGRCGTSLITI